MNTLTDPTTLAQPIGHAHLADLDACLDFINSEEYSDGLPEEHIPTVDDAVIYFTRRALAHEDAIRAQAAAAGAQAWLDRLHGFRAALREVWDSQVEARSPNPGALDAVNEVLRHAPRVELVPGLGGIGIGHRHVADDPTGEALARVVQPLVDAIASGSVDRFRICANDGCRWVFEDTSRGGRRRWCDMSSCGNRAKVRRYRSRHRDEGSEGSEGVEATRRPGGEPADGPAAGPMQA